MAFTKNIPTDKHGKVYYGPTTMAQAEAAIADGAEVTEVIEMLEAAGYTGVANRLRKPRKPMVD